MQQKNGLLQLHAHNKARVFLKHNSKLTSDCFQSESDVFKLVFCIEKIINIPEWKLWQSG